MKKLLCVLFIFHCSLFICFAQTVAEELETLLQTSAVTCGQAAWLVLESANSGRGELTAQEAFRIATEKQLLPAKAAPADTINLMQVSLLIMKAFEVKGGVWYSLFKTPHYAYREMVYQDIIQGRTDPRMDVSGEMLLFLVNRVLYRGDDNPWAMPSGTSTATATETSTEEQQ